MASQPAPRSIREQISTQQVGTETLVYDERRHKAFCLNRSSAAIWALADGTRPIAGIAAAASIELGAALDESFVLFALEQLCEDGLMEAPSAFGGPSVSRRALLRRLGAGSAMLLPAIAAILAPTPAQAYSGCFDCDDAQAAKAAQPATAQTARARQPPLGRSSARSSTSGAGTQTTAPVTPLQVGPAMDISPKLLP